MGERIVHDDRIASRSIDFSGTKLIGTLLTGFLLALLMTNGLEAQEGLGRTSIRITSPAESPWTNQAGSVVDTSENVYEPVKTTELNISYDKIAAPPIRLTQATRQAGNNSGMTPLPDIKPLPSLGSVPMKTPATAPASAQPNSGSGAGAPFPSVSVPKADFPKVPASNESKPNLPMMPGMMPGNAPAQLSAPQTPSSAAPARTSTTESIPLPIPNSAPIQLPPTKDTSKLLPESAPQETFLSPNDVLGSKHDARSKKEIDLPDGSRTTVTEEKTESPRQQNTAPDLQNLPNSQNRQNVPVPEMGSQSNKSNTKSQLPQISNIRPEESPIINNGNWFGLGRRKDGSMTGNPYSTTSGNSCEAKGYYPNYSRVIDTYNMPENRPEPPLEAYGTNLECDHPFSVTSNDCPNGHCGWLSGIFENMQLNLGILGFRNTVSNLEQGNFGLDLGLNWATPNSLLFGLSAQAGGHFVQSSSEGIEINGSTIGDDRSQFFWTSGIFHRGDCWQFGAVYDSLNDNYYEKFTLGQVRVELSKKLFCDLDFGFRGAFAIDDELVNIWRLDTLKQEKEQATAISWYSLFLRKYFEWGGEGMIYGGVTDTNDGLVGGQIEVPISDNIALKNSFSFVFSSENNRWNAIFDQTWNVSATFVFYLNGGARENSSNPLRPLFEVADNGTFLQGRK